jgi:hypothetical protein
MLDAVDERAKLLVRLSVLISEPWSGPNADIAPNFVERTSLTYRLPYSVSAR